MVITSRDASLAGSVYVFEYNGSSWIEVQQLYLSGETAITSGIDGNTIVIGTPQADINGFTDIGAIYIFQKSGTWPATETQKLLASDGVGSWWFGTSVSISGNTIVASAGEADPGGNSNQGAVYVFNK